MQVFIDYTGKDPETLLTLLEEAEKDIKSGKLMRQGRIKRDLTGFRKYLQNLGKAPPFIVVFFFSYFWHLYFAEYEAHCPHSGGKKTIKENKHL